MSGLSEVEREALAASVENGSHYEDERGLFQRVETIVAQREAAAVKAALLDAASAMGKKSRDDRNASHWRAFAWANWLRSRAHEPTPGTPSEEQARDRTPEGGHEAQAETPCGAAGSREVPAAPPSGREVQVMGHRIAMTIRLEGLVPKDDHGWAYRNGYHDGAQNAAKIADRLVTPPAANRSDSRSWESEGAVDVCETQHIDTPGEGGEG